MTRESECLLIKFKYCEIITKNKQKTMKIKKKINPIHFESVILGLQIILPIVIILVLLAWTWKIIVTLVKPLALVLAIKSDQTFFIDFLAVLLFLFFCYIVGAYSLTVRGRKIMKGIELKMFKKIPGYTFIKETILYFFRRSKVPFSVVALVRPYSNNTRQIAFVTENNSDGFYTVFLPTAPNPTSGNILILPKEQVEITKIPVDLAIKTIISCGINSEAMFESDEKSD
jgi:uncharacterized membrane protein